MIQLENVSLGYAKRILLENISFTAAPGNITAILGRNGCGKTTLLKAIMGNLPYQGSIRVDRDETLNLGGFEALTKNLIHAPNDTDTRHHG